MVNDKQTAEAARRHRDLLLLMLEHVHIGVSNGDIVVDDTRFPAPAPLRKALAGLMDEVVAPRLFIDTDVDGDPCVRERTGRVVLLSCDVHDDNLWNAIVDLVNTGGVR